MPTISFSEHANQTGYFGVSIAVSIGVSTGIAVYL